MTVTTKAVILRMISIVIIMKKSMIQIACHINEILKIQ